ncbi:uncharacterized protein J3D65DRAFT_629003 [Phyllosticta citribraziliensis]|uniref:Uncharacterized protein n=1 Tax=Phyllosticta citribraziliensis TaxID=989973 RepID=A0ABR1LHW7_9PEZI
MRVLPAGCCSCCCSRRRLCRHDTRHFLDSLNDDDAGALSCPGLGLSFLCFEAFSPSAASNSHGSHYSLPLGGFGCAARGRVRRGKCREGGSKTNIGWSANGERARVVRCGIMARRPRKPALEAWRRLGEERVERNDGGDGGKKRDGRKKPRRLELLVEKRERNLRRLKLKLAVAWHTLHCSPSRPRLPNTAMRHVSEVNPRLTSRGRSGLPVVTHTPWQHHNKEKNCVAEQCSNKAWPPMSLPSWVGRGRGTGLQSWSLCLPRPRERLMHIHTPSGQLRDLRDSSSRRGAPIPSRNSEERRGVLLGKEASRKTLINHSTRSQRSCWLAMRI